MAASKLVIFTLAGVCLCVSGSCWATIPEWTVETGPCFWPCCPNIVSLCFSARCVDGLALGSFAKLWWCGGFSRNLLSGQSVNHLVSQLAVIVRLAAEHAFVACGTVLIFGFSGFDLKRTCC